MTSIAKETFTTNSLNALIKKSIANKNNKEYSNGEYFGTIAAFLKLVGCFSFNKLDEGWFMIIVSLKSYQYFFLYFISEWLIINIIFEKILVFTYSLDNLVTMATKNSSLVNEFILLIGENTISVYLVYIACLVYYFSFYLISFWILIN